MSGQRIASVAELMEGATLKFKIKRAGCEVEGFVVNVRGQIVAYQNVCPHVALPLDDDDNQFFTQDREHLACHNHGALFEPLTGRCVRGPCEGEPLKRLPVVIHDGAVWLE